MNLTKMERKALKFILKNDIVTKEQLITLLTEKYYSDVMGNLIKHNLVYEISEGKDKDGFPIYAKVFRIEDRNKADGLLERHFLENQKFWIPIVISLIALLKSFDDEIIFLLKLVTKIFNKGN